MNIPVIASHPERSRRSLAAETKEGEAIPYEDDVSNTMTEIASSSLGLSSQ